MTIHRSPSPTLAMPMSERAYALRYAASQLIRIATGARVSWQGRTATVLSGNTPDAWAPTGTGTVSLEFDTYPRGATRYAEVFADELRILPALPVWKV